MDGKYLQSSSARGCQRLQSGKIWFEIERKLGTTEFLCENKLSDFSKNNSPFLLRVIKYSGTSLIRISG